MPRSNGKPLFTTVRIAIVGVCVALLLDIPVLYYHGRNSLREELSRMQRQSGMHLVQVSNNKIYAVDAVSRSLKEERRFMNKGMANFGTLSPDGKQLAFSYCSEPGFTHPSPSVTNCPAGNLHLGLLQLEGTSRLQEYFDWASPYGMCWSHDRSKLAFSVRDTSKDSSAPHRLVILDLKSAAMKEVAGMNSTTSTECWSPDDKQLVFTEHRVVGINNILLFDVEDGKTQQLAKGSGASWSPDGRLIGFSPDSYSYSVIEPDGTGERTLFKTTVADTELWWSPDCRYVAYVSAKGFFERWPLEHFIELRRLRIRRLKDGAEDSLLNLDTRDPIRFQWVTP
jgi:Tol biopolymer transport system component